MECDQIWGTKSYFWLWCGLWVGGEARERWEDLREEEDSSSGTERN